MTRMDTQITLIGIDCATVDSKVGLSIGTICTDRCVIQYADTCSSERSVAEVVVERLAGSTRALLAFDAPLGWPRPMGESLVAHQAGAFLSVEADELFRRETDRFVR